MFLKKHCNSAFIPAESISQLFLELNLYSFVLKKQRIGISKNFFPEILFRIFYRHRGDFYYDNTWTRFLKNS